jgi:hypothetical protein
MSCHINIHMSCHVSHSAMLESMCHATSTSMCHATSSRKWLMVDGQVRRIGEVFSCANMNG